MVAKVKTFAFLGIEAREVEVQVQIAPGLPSISIVGLADKAVAESKERIRAAFHSLGIALPSKKIIINLSPADIHKEGTHFDLPIAMAMLLEMKVFPEDEINEYFILGELSLDAMIKSVSGVLPAAITSNALGYGLACPYDNAQEALWSGNSRLLAPKNLLQLINHLKQQQILSRPEHELQVQTSEYTLDLNEIQGNAIPKRALIIAAAGGHNMLMIGPPGSGKSMLAKRMPGILPPLSQEEMLEVSIIASVAGIFKDSGLITKRPFRDPHSSSSAPALVGGGKNAKPGEISLAHNGVLFLDELPEYNKAVLDSLRQPIEDGKISIARVNNHVTYPARFQLVGAMNPCKCGYFGDAANACNKSPKCADEYQNKISGPIFDRFDIRVEVLNQSAFIHDEGISPIDTNTAREMVKKARNIQIKRYNGKGIMLNAHAEGNVLKDTINLRDDCVDMMKKAVTRFNLSMRGYNKILRVARTIADLENAEYVDLLHLSEAINFRMMKLRT